MNALAVLAAAALAAGPAKKNGPTRLRIEVKPENVVVFVDGTRKGTGKRAITLTLTPGKHKLHLTHDKDTVDDFVVVKKGETTNWKWEFTDDRPDKKRAKAEQEKQEEAPKAEAPVTPPEPVPAPPPSPNGEPTEP